MYLWLPAIAKLITGFLNNTSKEYNNLCINNRKKWINNHLNRLNVFIQMAVMSGFSYTNECISRNKTQVYKYTTCHTTVSMLYVNPLTCFIMQHWLPIHLRHFMHFESTGLDKPIITHKADWSTRCAVNVSVKTESLSGIHETFCQATFTMRVQHTCLDTCFLSLHKTTVCVWKCLEPCARAPIFCQSKYWFLWMRRKNKNFRCGQVHHVASVSLQKSWAIKSSGLAM